MIQVKQMILLSGPSSVGKGPLLAALKAFYPKFAFGGIPVIRSHGSRDGEPRPSEKDIWNNPDFFLPDDGFAGLDRQRYVVGDCRGYPQAIDLDQIRAVAEDLLILEVYHTIGAQFKIHAALENIGVTSVFVTPLSQRETETLRLHGVDTDAYLTHVMIEKQLRRDAFMGKPLTPQGMVSIIGRAKDAPTEMRSRQHYHYQITCHDGEGHPNWHQHPDGRFAGMPTGDAGNALEQLVEIIRSVG